MVYDTQITVVFLGFINQHSHHWGGPHCTSTMDPTVMAIYQL